MVNVSIHAVGVWSMEYLKTSFSIYIYIQEARVWPLNEIVTIKNWTDGMVWFILNGLWVEVSSFWARGPFPDLRIWV